MQYVWVILLFLPSTLSQYTGRFRVVVPEAPVFSVPGSDVVLSCSVRELDNLNILVNAVDLNVTWSRSDLRDSLVHLYGNHKDLNTDQIPSYRGRTAVFKEKLKNGDVSLKLSNVRISDEGEYRCRVDSTSFLSDKTIKLSVKDFVPSETGKTGVGIGAVIAGITIVVLLLVGVPAGLFLYVKLLLKSDKDGRLQHHNLSRCQWWYVKRTLLKSKEDLEEFNLRKFDPSDRGVEKLKIVIASSKKAVLKQCDLTEKSCEVLASVLSSENSLTELDLSLNKLIQDSGVKKLCEGLKSSHCKLQILRLEHCGLTEGSCADLAEVLKSENSKLIELNLSQNSDLTNSGVKILCDGLKDKNCKLEKLWLEFCNLTEESCTVLASVFQSENSKLIELNLSENKGLNDAGVMYLCDGLKDKNCKLQILRLKQCDLGEESCKHLAAVLKSDNSKLIELNLSKSPGLKDAGVNKLCDGLKHTNCELKILRLEFCNLTEESCTDLASVLISENSKLIELHLSENKLNDAGVKNLCDGLKDKKCKLQKLGLDKCSVTDKGFTALASALKENPSSPLEELDLSGNELEESELELLPELRTKFPKLKVKLDKCSAIENPSLPLKELDLSGNGLKESELELLPKLKDTFPNLKVKI